MEKKCLAGETNTEDTVTITAKSNIMDESPERLQESPLGNGQKPREINRE